MSSFHHVVEEVVTHYGPVQFLAKQVHDQHIAWLEHVDGRLIGQRPDTVFFGFGRSNLMHIGALGHELNSECSSDHWCFRMQDLKSVGVLVVKPLLFKNSPDFLRGKLPRTFQQILGHFWPAVGKTVERALRRIVGELLLGECQQLRVN